MVVCECVWLYVSVLCVCMCVVCVVCVCSTCNLAMHVAKVCTYVTVTIG